MGYWNTRKDGESLVLEDTGMLWGDSPADIMDKMLRDVVDAFVEDVGRPPTAGEVRAGLEFALGHEPDEKVLDPEEQVP